MDILKALLVAILLSLSAMAQTISGGTLPGQTVGTAAAASQSIYDQLCTAPTPSYVLKCFGMDTTPTQVNSSSANDGLDPVGGVYYGFLDTTNKANGAGSLRFDLVASCPADCAGSYHMSFSDSPWPVQFGAGSAYGSEVWIQWRQQFDTNFISLSPRQGVGNKYAIFGLGNATNGTVNNVASSCTDLELTTQEFIQNNFVRTYDSCGVKDAAGYENLIPQGTKSGSMVYIYQPGQDCTSAGTTNCYRTTADSFWTFQLHVIVGTDYTNNKNYHRDSTVELWAGPASSVPQLIATLTDTDLISHAITDGTYPASWWTTNGITPRRGKLWLTPYETGRCVSQVTLTSASRTSGGVITLNNNGSPSWYSQYGDCVNAGDSIVVSGMSDSSFNGTWTAISQTSTSVITVQSNVLSVATATGGTASNSTTAQLAAKTWYDSIVISQRALPVDGITVPNTIPSNLSVVNNGTDNVLTWYPNTDVTGAVAATSWELQRSPNNRYDALANISTFTTVGTGLNNCSGTPTVCTATDAGAAGTSYTYRVRGSNGVGSGAWSSPASDLPGIPSDISASSSTYNQAVVTWNQPNPTCSAYPASCTFTIERCADTVAVCENPSGAGSYTVIASGVAGNLRTYTDSTVNGGASGQTYSYRIKAVNSAGVNRDWGSYYYPRTSYGGGTAASQVAVAAAPSTTYSTNTWYDLGSGSNFRQLPLGTYNLSAICPDQSGLGLGCSSEIRAWCSGVYRWTSAYFDLNCGGHTDYYGTEHYAFEYSVSGSTMHRSVYNGATSAPVTPICSAHISSTLSNKAYPAIPANCVDGGASDPNCVDDGTHLNCTSSPKHTYGGVAWIPPGDISCSINGTVSNGDIRMEFSGITPDHTGTAYPGADIWLHFFDSTDSRYGKDMRMDTWLDATGLTAAPNGSDFVADWDRTNKVAVVWGSSTTGKVYTYDPCTNKLLLKTTVLPAGLGTGTMGIIDQNAHKLFLFGNATTRFIYSVDLTSWAVTNETSNYSSSDLYTTANTADTFYWLYLGLAWDSRTNEIAVWPNFGNKIWWINTATHGVTSSTGVGVTIPAARHKTIAPYTNGTFRRFTYDPIRDIYLLLNDYNQDTWLYCRNASGC